MYRKQCFICIQIRQFDTDMDPYHFKEVMYLKQYFYTSLLDFPCQQVQQGPTKRHTLLNFPFQLILVCSLEQLMDQDQDPRHPGTDPGSRTWKMIQIPRDPDPRGSRSATLIGSRGESHCWRISPVAYGSGKCATGCYSITPGASPTFIRTLGE